MLLLDEPQSDEIVCEEGFCQQWYRMDVPRPGTLRIEAKSLGNVLARKNNQHGHPLESVFPWVEGNVAAILVQCGKGRFPYSLTARLE